METPMNGAEARNKQYGIQGVKIPSPLSTPPTLQARPHSLP